MRSDRMVQYGEGGMVIVHVGIEHHESIHGK
jgi:hypothetical protein